MIHPLWKGSLPICGFSSRLCFGSAFFFYQLIFSPPDDSWFLPAAVYFITRLNPSLLILPDKFWYCRLSPNHKVLHYGDLEESPQGEVPHDSLQDKCGYPKNPAGQKVKCLMVLLKWL